MTTTATVAQGASGRLRANRDFRLLWAADCASELGSSVSGVAVPLALLAVTGSAAGAGTVASVALIAMWLAQIPAGQLADAAHGRRLMIWADLICAVASAALVGVIALAPSWRATMPGATGLVVVAVAACAVVVAVASSVYGYAQGRAVQVVVHQDDRRAASSLNQSRSFAVEIAGPSVGGWLFVLGRAVPFAVDAVSYVVSALCSTRLRVDLPPAPTEEERAHWWSVFSVRDARGSAAVIRRSRYLRRAVTFSLLGNVVVSMLLYSVLFDPANVHHSVLLGLTFSSVAACGLLGAVLAPRLQRRIGTVAVLRAVATIRVAGLLGALLEPGRLALAVALCVVFLSAPVLRSELGAAQLAVIPAARFGRVSSLIGFGAMLAQPAAPLLAGVLVEALSGRARLTVLAVGFAAAAVQAWRIPDPAAEVSIAA